MVANDPFKFKYKASKKVYIFDKHLITILFHNDVNQKI